MTPELLVATLGSTFVVGLIAWLTGLAADHAGLSASERHGLWTAGFWLSVAPLLLVPSAALLVPEPWPHSLGAAGAAAGQHGPAHTAAAHQGWVSTLAWLVISCAIVGVVVRLARLGLALTRLAGVARRAAPADREEFPAQRVRVTDAVASPILVGLRRPIILLPSSLAEDRDSRRLSLICAHERAHAVRGDNWRVLAEEVALAVLWFNLPLRAAQQALAAAREELCDAAALQDAGADDRRLYARALVQALENAAGTSLAARFIGSPRRHAGMRLTAILGSSPRKPRAALTVLALGGLAAASLGVSLAIAQTQPTRGTPPSAEALAAARPGVFDVYSDQIRSVDGSTIFEGNVSIVGALDKARSDLLIDGSPAPASFDLGSVKAQRFSRVEIRPDKDGRRGFLNLVTAP